MVSERITAIRDRAKRSLRDNRSIGKPAGNIDVIVEAQLLSEFYRTRPLVIHPGELLVGDYPRIETNVIQTPKIFGRQTWRGGRSWEIPSHLESAFGSGLLSWAGNHKTLDFDTIFDIGFSGILARARSHRERLNQSDLEYMAKSKFLEGLTLIAEAYIEFSNRYSSYAGELALREENHSRANELREIAENCSRVPAGPPSSFWEACQCAWFSFFFVPDAPGRVDQYLHPFYQADIDAGKITRDFAKELISCLWLKYFESVGPQSGVSAHNHLTLGGLHPDGSDASNAVTILCLEVTEELELLRPQVGLRCNSGTPDNVVERAIEVLRSKTGNPDFCNDEQIVPALVGVGVSVEDARNFSLSGCHEVIVTGMAQMGSVEGFINLGKILEAALGLAPEFADDIDVADISSFEQFWQHLERIIEAAVDLAHQASLARDEFFSNRPDNYLETSLVTRDCIERGRGYTQGGARYNFCNWDIIGTANLADSLAAIRKLVFEDRQLTLQQLADLLSRNWAGNTGLRTRIQNQLPHFGNGDETDGLAVEIIETISAAFKRLTPFRGGEYILGTTAGGENMHIEFGRRTGATPDGRESGAPLADSIGPAQGRDRNGVTTMLNSVARLPHNLLPTATTLNVQLDPKLLDTPAGIEKTAALLRSHFASGGQQLQFNFYDTETLLDAKAHPERHENLMVRVAGYSAPFVSLWDDLQDEVIARTEHAM